MLNKLNEERNKNRILLEELNNEKTKVTKLNDKIQTYKNSYNHKLEKIKELKELIKSKNSEINYLKIFNNEHSSIKLGEKIISIFFTSISQGIISFSISCKNTDTFAKVEEKIYDKYPQYKDCNTYLTVNGNIIKRFKTLEENRIKDGNFIIINVYDEENK